MRVFSRSVTQSPDNGFALRRLSAAVPSYRAGFTLIELLVVIAIIGLLASIVLASLSSARTKARDSKRISDIKEFQKALELYYDANGHYPYSCSTGTWSSFDSPSYSPDQLCAGLTDPTHVGTLTQVMAPYIGKLSDPKSLGGDSGYLYLNRTGADSYCILFWRTPENLNDFPSGMIPKGRCSAWNSAGQCTSGNNTIYIGRGSYANGC